MVIDTRHDLILGKKWFDYHDVMVDVRRRRLLFPPEWPASPDYSPPISMDESGDLPSRPEWDDDVKRREVLMDAEDRRRRAGRTTDLKKKREEEEAILARIAELSKPQTPAPRPFESKPVILGQG